MNHTDLVLALSQDLRPVSPRSVERTLAMGLAAGSVSALVALLVVYGLQPDLIGLAIPFLIKFAYTAAIALAGFSAMLALARPGAPRVRLSPLMGAPALLGLLALISLIHAPHVHWHELVFGRSWSACPVRVAALSVPIFAALTLSLRQQAPERHRIAGAAAGLLSGAIAAMIYALACNETSPVFILLWYSAGIGVCAAAGSLVGPYLLRW